MVSLSRRSLLGTLLAVSVAGCSSSPSGHMVAEVVESAPDDAALIDGSRDGIQNSPIQQALDEAVQNEGDMVTIHLEPQEVSRVQEVLEPHTRYSGAGSADPGCFVRYHDTTIRIDLMVQE